MARIIIALVLVYTFLGCSPNKRANKEDSSKPIPIVDFKKVEPLLHKSNDTLYVINFWATWCAPCVKEIPYFERIASEFSDNKIEVILINLDFPNHYESRLLPFIEMNKVKSRVLMLDDPDANRWINEVDTSWSGSIPATLIYNKSKRRFYEKEFSYKELQEAVSTFLN